jgi:hypothetical protein
MPTSTGEVTPEGQIAQLKNREGVFTLLYSLFDKEATRQALSANRKGQGHSSRSRGQGQDAEEQVQISTARSKRIEPLKSNSSNRGHSNESDPTLTLEEDEDIDPNNTSYMSSMASSLAGVTPMPNLSFVSDRPFRDKLHRSSCAIPPLNEGQTQGQSRVRSKVREVNDFNEGFRPASERIPHHHRSSNNMEKVLNGSSSLLPSKVQGPGQQHLYHFMSNSVSIPGSLASNSNSTSVANSASSLKQQQEKGLILCE